MQGMRVLEGGHLGWSPGFGTRDVVIPQVYSTSPLWTWDSQLGKGKMMAALDKTGVSKDIMDVVLDSTLGKLLVTEVGFNVLL